MYEMVCMVWCVCDSWGNEIWDRVVCVWVIGWIWRWIERSMWNGWVIDGVCLGWIIMNWIEFDVEYWWIDYIVFMYRIEVGVNVVHAR